MMLSVIVPVYNVQKYLDQCVESVLKQTYTDFEVILVDDGSTDNSGKMCDDWAQKDDRIKVVHQKNQGLSGARNTGIEASEGEYLVFVDSDDLIAENMFSTLMPMMTDENLDAVWCTFNRFYNDDVNDSRACQIMDMLCEGKEEIIKNMVLPIISSDNPQFETPGTMCGVIYRADIIRKSGLRVAPVKESSSEDNQFNVRFLPLCSKVKWVNLPLYCYRKNMASLSNNIKDYTVPSYKNFERQLLEMAKGWNVDYAEVERRCKRRIITAFSTVAKIVIANNSLKESKKTIKKYITDNDIDTSFTAAELKNTDFQVALFWVLLEWKMYLPLYLLVRIYNRFIVK